MGSEGYIPISVIASFNRVQALTQDVTHVIAFISQSLDGSEVVDVKDGISVRPKNNPTMWPLTEDPGLSKPIEEESIYEKNNTVDSKATAESVATSDNKLSNGDIEEK